MNSERTATTSFWLERSPQLGRDLAVLGFSVQSAISPLNVGQPNTLMWRVRRTSPWGPNLRMSLKKMLPSMSCWRSIRRSLTGPLRSSCEHRRLLCLPSFECYTRMHAPCLKLAVYLNNFNPDLNRKRKKKAFLAHYIEYDEKLVKLVKRRISQIKALFNENPEIDIHLNLFRNSQKSRL